MKTKNLLLAILLVNLIFSAPAQIIPNGSFENWTTLVQYEDPIPYVSTNMNVFMTLGTGNVSKSTQSHGGNYAVKLETVSLGTDTMFGSIFIGTPSSGGISGGYPYVGHPDSIEGYTKYQLQTNDTAQFIIIFKKAGTPIGSASTKFYGTQSGYTKFKIPVSWLLGVNSDTIAAVISSSNFNAPRIPGSQIFFDDLVFKNTPNPFPNGDFETWTTYATESPDSWTGFNWACFPGDTSITKTTDSYDGQYALKLKTLPLIFGDTTGLVTNGYFSASGPAGGSPVSLNPEKISGYYKYSPNGLDTALAAVLLYRYDALSQSSVLLEMQMKKLPPASIYTYFEIPMSYNSFPYTDTVDIIFASSNVFDPTSYIGIGSTLYIDQLEITYYPVSLSDNITEKNNISIFPNPSDGNISIVTGENVLNISIYDITGKCVYSGTIIPEGNTAKLNLSYLQSGIYFLKTGIEKTGKVLVIN